MAIQVVAGRPFPAVSWGTALDEIGGYLVGGSANNPLLNIGGTRPRLAGLKYFEHSVGDPPKGPRPPDPYVRVALLVYGGPFWMRLWQGNDSVSVKLVKPGDYVVWTPGVEHQWLPECDCRVVTLNFSPE